MHLLVCCSLFVLIALVLFLVIMYGSRECQEFSLNRVRHYLEKINEPLNIHREAGMSIPLHSESREKWLDLISEDCPYYAKLFDGCSVYDENPSLFVATFIAYVARKEPTASKVSVSGVDIDAVCDILMSKKM